MLAEIELMIVIRICEIYAFCGPSVIRTIRLWHVSMKICGCFRIGLSVLVINIYIAECMLKELVKYIVVKCLLFLYNCCLATK